MSHKSRQRLIVAAGAALAGAAIPIALAGSAWAQTDIIVSYDGKVLFDTFPSGAAAGASDANTPALSGMNNDTATFIGPAGDYQTAANDAAVGSGGAIDNSSGDVGDSATDYDTGTGGVGLASVYNATYSTAYTSGGGSSEVWNFGNGTVEFDHASASGGPTTLGQVWADNTSSSVVTSGDGAYATNGATAQVLNFGTANAQNDVATANGAGGVGGVYETGSQAVSSDYASGFGGDAFVIGDGNATSPVIVDSATSFGTLAEIVDKSFQFVFMP
jgi:hypothetical protein